MKRILILFAHPALQTSRVNKHLIAGLGELEGVTFHDLYEHYPEFDIDVAAEQALLVEHDIVIFQHPMFWYSIPALLKEWQDLVLEHGWAYGHKGQALEGKLFFNAITTGGRAEAYHAEGHNHYTIRQLLAPVEQTFRLCRMVCLPPFVVHGTHGITPEEVAAHKEHYRRTLMALRDDKLDIAAALQLNTLNDHKSDRD